MAKKPETYSLDEKVIEFVGKKAVKASRSKSFMANEMLLSLMPKGKK